MGQSLQIETDDDCTAFEIVTVDRLIYRVAEIEIAGPGLVSFHFNIDLAGPVWVTIKGWLLKTA
jgi:hypothetical protein